jgi:hypothetical protein
VTTPQEGRAVPDDELPDTRLFWLWVGKATRPVVGWVLVAIGALMIVVGYVGVARQVLVAKQLPYLVSGGILGIAVVAVGVMFLGTEQIRRDSGRLDRLEGMVHELHLVLLARPDAPLADVQQALARAEASPASAVANGGATGLLVALEEGERYHFDTCDVVRGKPAVEVTPRTIRRRALSPCPLCAPSPV